jgi:Uri superfamily endonuclease
MNGTYLLVIDLKKDQKIQVGKLGRLYFKEGSYIYIGKATRGLDSRIRRHLSKDKNLFWHIDYLLESPYATIFEVWTVKERNVECLIAREIYDKVKPDIPAPKFGSSDCNCPTHLFFLGSNVEKVSKLLSRFGFERTASPAPLINFVSTGPASAFWAKGTSASG